MFCLQSTRAIQRSYIIRSVCSSYDTLFKQGALVLDSITIKGLQMTEIDLYIYIYIFITAQISIVIIQPKISNYRYSPSQIMYIIITKNLLWNWGVWRFFHDTYLTIEVQGIRCTNHLHDSCPLTDVNPHFTAPGCRYYFKINSWWPIVTSSTHGPAASYCDVTMAHCSHGYLWTHDVEAGASWRDCDNLRSPELFGTWLHHFAYRWRDCDNLRSPELFGTWLHHFAYRWRDCDNLRSPELFGSWLQRTLGDQIIYTRFGLICLFTLLIIFGLPCFNTGHR